MNYLVVVFKNKERKKIINKFKTKERANLFFDKLIEENKSVIFETKVENAKSCDYELSILEKKNDNFDKMFVRDEMGRQVLVDLDDPDYKIVKVAPDAISITTLGSVVAVGPIIKALTLGGI
jgi:hypothetical protein